MKNLLIIFMIAVVGVIMTGCALINPVITTADTTLSADSPVISPSKVLMPVDIAPDYNISGTSLQVYKDKDDPYTSYVNVTEFINFMQGGIVPLTINQDTGMDISYTFDIPKEDQKPGGPTTYTYNMMLDPADDSVKISDFDMLDNMNTDPLTPYDTSLTISHVDEVDDPDPSVTIPLSNYHMNIVVSDGDYYIPLYLANLLLTGSYINVYEMNDRIYIFDDASDLSELTNQYDTSFSYDMKSMAANTNDYLELYFDYFYGLKKYKQVGDYMNILSTYDLNDKTSVQDLNSGISKFIGSLNDLHTSIVSGGYMNRNFHGSYTNNKLTNYVSAYYTNSCQYRKDEISDQAYGDTLVIQVNGFSLDTRTELVPVMTQAKNYSNIIFDLGCNPGGNVIGVVELLSYMTDADVPLTYYNPVSKTKVTEYYDTKSNADLNKNFYVYTTAATYSAANLFTSIVKDMDLGVIFGEQSGGGAAAIEYTVLPDGAILVSSSDMLFLNKAGNVIEDGIPVDVEKTYPFNWSTVVSSLQTNS